MSSSTTSGSLAPPRAPSTSVSSKRSRSRDPDSARSSSSALSNPSANVSSAALSTRDGANEGGAGTLQQQQPSPDIPLPWFLRQKRTDIHNKFQDLEWQQGNRLVQQMTAAKSTEQPSQWARVTGEEVLKRNRYMNVDPFLNNRVILKVPEGHDPYINASPITLRSTKTGQPRNFIATQGPKANTHSHIWRMLWHECASPATIIMLTQTHESGREKCYPYFPPSLTSPTMIVNQADEFGDSETLTITLVSLTEDAESRSTVRELEVRNNEGESKKVWHLLFEAWPDFGVPEEEDHKALLKLIPLSREKSAQAHTTTSSDPATMTSTSTDDSSKPNPRIVHCSAGVGRSGTFIALDHLLSELEEGSLDDVPEGKDPIAETVERLREQRMMMVQGELQFGLLYETVRERWVERWKARHGFGRGGEVEKTGGDAGTGPGEEMVLSEEEEGRDFKVARLGDDLEDELRANAALAKKL